MSITRMKERFRQTLHHDILQALGLTQRLTGKEPLIKRVADLPNNVRAVLYHPRFRQRPYEIHFRKGEESVLEHLIAHEVGHIVRLHQIPEEERLLAVVTAATRGRAALQMLPELVGLLEQGLSPPTLGELIVDWHQALCEQVTNFPADLRIEQWLYERFPRLRKVQERSLVQEVERGYESLHPAVAALTPPSISGPTVAMNAAQAVHVAQLFAKPELLKPYGCLRDRGERLLAMVFDAVDEGHRSDIAATNRWAQYLNLTGWFEWRLYCRGA